MVLTNQDIAVLVTHLYKPLKCPNMVRVRKYMYKYTYSW